MPARTPSERAGPLRGIRGAWRVLVLALRVRRDPVPFCREVAAGIPRYLRSRGVRLDGATVLDVGAGGGALAEAVAGARARTVALDLQDHRGPGVARTPLVLGRAERLPFAGGSFDVVLCSNVLEHVPHTRPVIDELARVCRPGGFVWLSWTNWLSPLGGHEMSPFHYLGPRLGSRVYRAVWRRPPRWNVLGETLFVVHVGPTLRRIREGPLEITDVTPRYWPSLRFLGRIPGLREVAMWNCVVLLRKPDAVMAGSDEASRASTGGTPPAS